MNNLQFKDVIDYIVNKTPWKDDTSEEIIIKQAYKAYKDISQNKTKEKVLYRICGQTGSGKTTQLLYAIENYVKTINKDPIVLGVRSCATYHPDYDNLLKIHGSSNIREITNGFALKCMTYTLKPLIENGYMILLDITLLDSIYENYILNLLNENGYTIKYHLMGVSNDVSTSFLKKRELETGRKVASYSSEYFNYILDVGFDFLSNNDIKNNACIWNAFDLDPVYVGPIKDSKNTFYTWRNTKKEFQYSETQLKEAKLNYLLNEKEG